MPIPSGVPHSYHSKKVFLHDSTDHFHKTHPIAMVPSRLTSKFFSARVQDDNIFVLRDISAIVSRKAMTHPVSTGRRPYQVRLETRVRRG